MAMEQNEGRQLTEAELEQVSGGEEITEEQRVYDCRGREVGVWNYNPTRLYYWPCKKCGKPCHLDGNVKYCDPCNKWYVMLSLTWWKGTEAELIAAGNANL